MQQQQNSLTREMQQRLQASAALLQPQNAGDQRKLFMQSQRPIQEVSSSTSVESTAQAGPAGGVDWQEEIYQKIISMKELYYADLSELYHRIVMKLQQHDALMPPGKLSDQYDKMKNFKTMLERTLAILKLNKGNNQVGLKDKLPLYEKQIQVVVHEVAGDLNMEAAASESQSVAGELCLPHFDEFLESISAVMDVHLRYFKQGYELLSQLASFIHQVLTYAQQSKEMANNEQDKLAKRIQEFRTQAEIASLRSLSNTDTSTSGDGIHVVGVHPYKKIEL